MQLWMEQQLQKALVDYANHLDMLAVQDEKRKAFLERMESIANTPDSFLQLSGILGTPEENFSWDKLREEALTEKYRL